MQPGDTDQVLIVWSAPAVTTIPSPFGSVDHFEHQIASEWPVSRGIDDVAEVGDAAVEDEAGAAGLLCASK